MSDAVDFLHADKHESLLQIDTKIFWWVWSSIPKVPKKASLQCLYNIPKKVRDEVEFFDADKDQSFLRVNFNTLDIKVFYSVIDMIMKTWRAWWWEWSSILKVFKVTSLQCLYNISKKKLWMEFIDMSRHVRIPKKGSLLNFCNVSQLLLCSIMMQNIQILYWVPIMFAVICFWLVVVRSGRGLLDNGALKSVVSQESELIKWADFFCMLIQI